MQIIRRIKLDFARESHTVKIFAKQGDINSRYVEIEPLENGLRYQIPDGVIARFAAKKPDGTEIFNDYPTISENIITVVLTEQTLAAAGDVECDIQLYQEESGQVLKAQTFVIRVRPDVLKNAKSSSEYQSYEAALLKIEDSKMQAVAAVEAAKNALAEAEAALTKVDDAQGAYDQMMNDFGNLGGIAVSEEEPTNPRIHAYINPKRGRSISVVTAEDIAQELGDDPNKVLSQKVATETLEQQEGFFIPVRGVNRLNMDAVTNGYLVAWNNGNLVENARYFASEYIDITRNNGYVSAYVCRRDNKAPQQPFFRCAFYDENKMYISGVDNNGKDTDITNATMEVPENARYIRASFAINANHIYMIVLSDNIANYEPYNDYIRQIGELSQEFGDDPKKVISQEIITATLEQQKDYFFKREATNKINPATMEKGYYPSNANGTPVTNANMISTDFINVAGVETISAYACLTEDTQAPQQPFFRGAFYDENKAFISGIDNNSHSNDITYATISVPENAVYFRCGFIYNTNFCVYMCVAGSKRPNYIKYVPDVTPIPTKISELKSMWSGKTWLSYGDSITAMGNGNNTGWQRYVTDIMQFSKHYGRGIGGQTYRYNVKPWFANADGSYNSRKDSATMLDSSSYILPEGCTAHYGYFASWDRIKTMISDEIKDSIDLIFMFGVNDAGNTPETFTPPIFSSSNTTDAAWASAPENVLGGDFDITEFVGAVTSTIMKLQARCPKAQIVIGTSWSGRGVSDNSNGAEYNGSGLAIWQEGEMVKQIANYFSIPCVDIWANTNVNPFNRSEYNEDSIHPYKMKGKQALARAVISGLMGIYPRFDT